jgi:hypothetical protein
VYGQTAEGEIAIKASSHQAIEALELDGSVP